MKEKILALVAEGKSFKETAKIVGCNISTVHYHCGKNGKLNRAKAVKKYRKEHPLKQPIKDLNYNLQCRIYNFLSRISKKHKRLNNKTTFKDSMYAKVTHFNKKAKMSNQPVTLETAIEKFNSNPKCYLTGDDIDINKTRAYHFDHIIPISRGGDNSIDNLGFCTKQANLAKNSMTPDEFFFFCKKILEHQGYTVTK